MWREFRRVLYKNYFQYLEYYFRIIIIILKIYFGCENVNFYSNGISKA